MLVILDTLLSDCGPTQGWHTLGWNQKWNDIKIWSLEYWQQVWDVLGLWMIARAFYEGVRAVFRYSMTYDSQIQVPSTLSIEFLEW